MKRTFPILIACVFLLSCAEGERVGKSPKDLVNTSIIEGYTHAKIYPEEQSLLAQLLTKNENGALRSLVLLRNEDRVAAVWWEERENAEKLFEQLAEKLFPLLSKNAKNIVDTVIHSEADTPIELLAFTDAALHSERIFFARIGNTLYEFHGNDEEGILNLLKKL